MTALGAQGTQGTPESNAPPREQGRLGQNAWNHTELPACRGERVIRWTTMHPRQNPKYGELGSENQGRARNNQGREKNAKKQRNEGPTNDPGDKPRGARPTPDRTRPHEPPEPATGNRTEGPTGTGPGRAQPPGGNPDEPTSVHPGSPVHYSFILRAAHPEHQLGRHKPGVQMSARRGGSARITPMRSSGIFLSITFGTCRRLK